MSQVRIEELVKLLNLKPHPEGGFFAETYRSDILLETRTGKRNLMTSIYFLLTSESSSKFHQIKSDEMWFYHEGSPLTVHLLHDSYQQLRVGPVNANTEAKPYQMVPSGAIFGSTVDEGDSYSLVSCTVAPGFDFEDFRLLMQEELLKSYPQNFEIISRLT